MSKFILSRDKAGLLIVDVQEKVFNQVERPQEVVVGMQQAICGLRILGLPIVVCEQYPQGLGSTVCAVKQCLDENQKYLQKTTFSCMGDTAIKNYILSLPIDQWVMIGIEAHICVLQTAKDLLLADKQVVVLNDAISSRSIYDFSTAIAEMRDCGVRISSSETILFELLRDSKAREFREISHLLR